MAYNRGVMNFGVLPRIPGYGAQYTFNKGRTFVTGQGPGLGLRSSPQPSFGSASGSWHNVPLTPPASPVRTISNVVRNPTMTRTIGTSMARGGSLLAQATMRTGTAIAARMAAIPYIGPVLAGLALAALTAFAIYKMVSAKAADADGPVTPNSTEAPNKGLLENPGLGKGVAVVAPPGPRPGGGLVVPRRPGVAGEFDPCAVIRRYSALLHCV